MNLILRIIIVTIVFILIGCTKRNSYIIDVAEQYPVEYSINDLQEYIGIRYVNAPNGLRVRDLPSLDGERIALLDDLSEVMVLKEDENIINIDGIDGKWTYIVFDDIEGWVFGGYLSLEKSGNNIIQLTNIKDISEYIYKDLNLSNRSNRSNITLDDLFLSLGINEEYEIISKRTLQSIHGDFYDDYIVNTDTYKMSLFRNSSNYVLTSIEIIINENNYLHLFPYYTMDEYLFSAEFGVIFRRDSNHITFLENEYDLWSLIFLDGSLSSIKWASTYW